VEERRLQLVNKLTPFQRADDQVEVALPAADLIGFVNQALMPIPIQVSVTTAGTRGLIAKAIILHGDRVFGDVGLELRPQGNTFGTGSAAIVPATATWSGQLGVSVTSVVTANASISMDLHLDTGIGGGTGNSLKLDATASANVPLHASFEKRSISEGTAILIQPTVSCSPGIVDVHPGVSPAFSLPWVVVSPVGLQLETEFGGTQIAPAVITDGLPIVIAMPIPKDKNGQRILRDPDKAIVRFEQPYVGLTILASDAKMSDVGVRVTGRASIAPRKDAETETETENRAGLRRALAENSPKQKCKTLTGLKLVGGDATIVDIYKELQFVAQNADDHIAIAKDIWAAVSTISPKYTAENLAKALQDSVKAGVDTFQHSLDVVTGVTQMPVPTSIPKTPTEAAKVLIDPGTKKVLEIIGVKL
jgi:hypothetical protein